MGVTSKVDICNIALGYAGEAETANIDTPTDVSGKACKRFYELKRRETLRGHTWNFAIKRTSLAADATAPSYQYTTKYLLPSDFVRLKGIGSTGIDFDYDIEGNYILTDASAPLKISYVSDVSDVAQFDATFINALALNLASSLAMALPKNKTLSKDLYQMYEEALKESKSIDGQERPPRLVRKSNILAARAGHAFFGRRTQFPSDT